MNKCFKNDFRSKQPWSFRKFMHHAKQFKTKREWMEKDKSSLNYFYKMRKSGDLTKKECEKIMENITQEVKFWTSKEILCEAKKYQRKIDWRTNAYASYKAASSNPKLYKKCVSHMPKCAKSDYKSMEIYNAQPLFEKQFKSLKLRKLKIFKFNKKNILQQNVNIDYKAGVPDFFILNTKSKNFIFIEIKRDDTWKTPNEILIQVKKYESMGKNNKKYKGTFIFSPKGSKNIYIPYSKIKEVTKEIY